MNPDYLRIKLNFKILKSLLHQITLIVQHHIRRKLDRLDLICRFYSFLLRIGKRILDLFGIFSDVLIRIRLVSDANVSENRSPSADQLIVNIIGAKLGKPALQPLRNDS